MKKAWIITIIIMVCLAVSVFSTKYIFDDYDFEGVYSIYNLSSISFNVTNGDPAHHEGLLFYDSTHKSLSYYNDDSDVLVNIGQEMILRVRNTQGSTIYDGQVVYIDGATGHTPDVKLAIANDTNKIDVIGIVTSGEIADNDFGYITLIGAIHGLDTSMWSEGDKLYLSSTVFGNLTTTKPSAPNFIVHLGYVEYAHSSQGIITVNVGHAHDTYVYENLTINNQLTVGAITIDCTAGENLVAGNIAFMNSSGKFWKTNATAEATSKGMLVMAVDSISADASGKCMTSGTLVTSGLTTGDELYLDDSSAGGYTSTQPSDTGDIVRIVGYSLNTTNLYFDPDQTYVEI